MTSRIALYPISFAIPNDLEARSSYQFRNSKEDQILELTTEEPPVKGTFEANFDDRLKQMAYFMGDSATINTRETIKVGGIQGLYGEVALHSPDKSSCMGLALLKPTNGQVAQFSIANGKTSTCPPALKAAILNAQNDSSQKPSNAGVTHTLPMSKMDMMWWVSVPFDFDKPSGFSYVNADKSTSFVVHVYSDCTSCERPLKLAPSTEDMLTHDNNHRWVTSSEVRSTQTVAGDGLATIIRYQVRDRKHPTNGKGRSVIAARLDWKNSISMVVRIKVGLEQPIHAETVFNAWTQSLQTSAQ